MSRKTIIGLAEGILKSSKKSMSISEITSKVRSQININSKTPEKTVSSALQRLKSVVRIERGLYRYKG